MKRALALTLAVAAAVMASKLLVEDVLGLPLQATASAWIQDAGTGSAMLIVGLLALDVFLPIPSSLVMILSGAVFGVAGGAALALVGSIAGEWLGFELVRRFGRRASTKMIGEGETLRLHAFFEQHGVLAVIITRPLPIVMETISIVAGLSTMSRRAFLGASLAGTAPIVLLYAYAGAFSRETGSILPGLVMLVSVSGAGWLWYRRRFAATLPATSSEGWRGSRRAARTPSPDCRS